jgi:DNA-binding NarL/FixJ family response regulator
VVLTDGNNEAIQDHALSVGAAACLSTSLPAREVVSRLRRVATSWTQATARDDYSVLHGHEP